MYPSCPDVPIVIRDDWNLLEKNAEAFERLKARIVLIDDHSSLEIPECFRNSPWIYYRLPDEYSGKWQGLNYGMKQCDSDRVLLTDADCKPESGWLESMNSFEEDALVLGISPMKNRPNLTGSISQF